ncbi:MAG: hypothetical protein ACKPGI_13935, partial [Verrucomicrobiota bacterium]
FCGPAGRGHAAPDLKATDPVLHRWVDQCSGPLGASEAPTLPRLNRRRASSPHVHSYRHSPKVRTASQSGHCITHPR